MVVLIAAHNRESALSSQHGMDLETQLCTVYKSLLNINYPSALLA